MAMITGGELVVRTLMRANVKYIFGLHGAHLETIFQSCLDHHIPITDTRHEVAAGHAAEGYARATRGLAWRWSPAGRVSRTSSRRSRTPISIARPSSISAVRPACDAETNTLQAGLDQVAVVTPITKWAHRITIAQDIPRLVAEAIRLATSGPTGPVLLDLPADCSARKSTRPPSRFPRRFFSIPVVPGPERGRRCAPSARRRFAARDHGRRGRIFVRRAQQNCASSSRLPAFLFLRTFRRTVCFRVIIRSMAARFTNGGPFRARSAPRRDPRSWRSLRIFHSRHERPPWFRRRGDHPRRNRSEEIGRLRQVASESSPTRAKLCAH